ncbi:hypothetical protein PHMEG_0002276 [Phytophthora megakarya]|uniref:Uncharacterized protein n=1 Tax=Phytophthora megakarya TaxID=4795 RepID=A0A225WZ30_9STRA|nr:hypothetical protein PHMEG_0002276 [Phytophthora megakarya]
MNRFDRFNERLAAPVYLTFCEETLVQEDTKLSTISTKNHVMYMERLSDDPSVTYAIVAETATIEPPTMPANIPAHKLNLAVQMHFATYRRKWGKVAVLMRKHGGQHSDDVQLKHVRILFDKLLLEIVEAEGGCSKLLTASVKVVTSPSF